MHPLLAPPIFVAYQQPQQGPISSLTKVDTLLFAAYLSNLQSIFTTSLSWLPPTYTLFHTPYSISVAIAALNLTYTLCPHLAPYQIVLFFAPSTQLSPHVSSFCQTHDRHQPWAFLCLPTYCQLLAYAPRIPHSTTINEPYDISCNYP